MPTTMAPPPTNTVFAVWSGQTFTQSTLRHPSNFIDAYTVIVRPQTPLSVGQAVRLLTLRPEANHVPAYPLPYNPRLDVLDPKVEGRITRVHSIENGIIEFALENSARGDEVRMVYVAVQYVPDVTVKLGVVDRVYKWLTRDLPSTRFIPLDERIVVNETVTHSPAATAHQAGPGAHGRIRKPALRKRRVGEIREALRPNMAEMDTAPLVAADSEMDGSTETPEMD